MAILSRQITRRLAYLFSKADICDEKAMRHKNIILYGAGLGAKRTLKHLPSSYKIVAVADDNAATHGSSFLGIPVIFPAQIAQFSYDMVVITSWIHAKSIFSRLAELEVSESKIFVAHKHIVMQEKVFPWKSFIFLFAGLLPLLVLTPYALGCFLGHLAGVAHP
jgi:FlaA1/EpsC-like NDP-sugar epimerase